MRFFFLSCTIATYVVYGSPECWSPSMPGPSGCSICTSNELNGSQCVRSGRWFTCYDTVEKCCKDGEVLNHTSESDCKANAMKDANHNEDGHGDEGNNEEGAVTSEDVCERVVARSPVTTNRQCMKECRELVKKGQSPTKDEAWSQKCMTAHWHAENGRTVIEGSCFQKWVYGYSEPNNLASYKLKLEAETPALCQALCQEDDDCINWLWVSPLYAPGTEVAKRCMLKSRIMVEKALTMSTETQPPKNLDVNYCNYQMGWTCQNLYKCLPCEGERRCVWESDMHISGWKYCDHEDSCEIHSPSSAPLVTSDEGKTIGSLMSTPSSSGPQSTSALASTPTRPGSSSIQITVNAVSISEERSSPSTPLTASLPTELDDKHTSVPSESEVVSKSTSPKESSSSQMATSSGSKEVVTTVSATISTELDDHVTRGPQEAEESSSEVAIQSNTQVSSSVSVEVSARTTAEVLSSPTSTPIVSSNEGDNGTTKSESGETSLTSQSEHPTTDDSASSATTLSVTMTSSSSSPPSGPKESTEHACEHSSTATDIILDDTTISHTTIGTKPKCPPSGCSSCSCCGSRGCNCCQQSGILLRIAEKPKHLVFEINN